CSSCLWAILVIVKQSCQEIQTTFTSTANRLNEHSVPTLGRYSERSSSRFLDGTTEKRLFGASYCGNDVLRELVDEFCSPEGILYIIINHPDVLEIEWYILLVR